MIRTPLFKVFMPESVVEAVRETLFSGYIAEGDRVALLTKMVSEYIGNNRTVLVNSGTSALTLAFRLAGVRPGVEVISTPLTCVASNVPILDLGGVPVWGDVDPETGMLDPDGIETLINEKTKAICILHKEGDPARLDEILAIAKKHDLKVIEDCAHSFGSRYKEVKIGNHGDFCCFSFQAIKHMTTGDGGALTCKNETDFQRAKRLKWFGVDHDKQDGGKAWLRDIPEWGYKMNMNDISASIGIECIKHIDEINTAFNKNGTRYSELLKDVPGVSLIRRDPKDYSIFWAYCLIAENREGLVEKLAGEGIAAGQIHPRNDIYSMFDMAKRNLPNTDYFSAREICVPCGWWVDEEEVERICSIIRGGW